MRIVDVRERTVSIGSPIANAAGIGFEAKSDLYAIMKELGD